MAAKSGLGVKVLIVGGAVVAGTVAVVASGMFRSEPADPLIPAQPTAAVAARESGTVGSSQGIDYNCNLPGNGCPWLQHLPPQDWEADDPEETSVTILDGTHLQGFFQATTPPGDYIPYTMWLPMAIGPDGPAWPDVYRTVCALHPDLGGSGLRPVPFEELDRLLALPEDDDGVEGDPTVATRWLTDDVTRSADEAHFAHEPIRIYSLPDLPPYVREYLTSQSCEPAVAEATTSTTTTPAERHRFGITVTGYFIHEFNPLWRDMFNRGRQAVRFDYVLEGQLVLRRLRAEDGATSYQIDKMKWAVEQTTVTAATVSFRELFGPPGWWELGEVGCRGCGDIRSGSSMRGWITPLTGGDGLEEAEGPYLWISWRLPTPRVEVRSVAIGCAGQNVCPNDEWGTVTFSGDEFDSRATLEFADTETLIRTGELTKTEHVTNPQGTRWLEWTYRITRLG